MAGGAGRGDGHRLCAVPQATVAGTVRAAGADGAGGDQGALGVRELGGSAVEDTGDA